MMDILSPCALLIMRDKMDEFWHALRRALVVFSQHHGGGGQGSSPDGNVMPFMMSSAL
jgi:hypothetical protein